MAKKDKGSTFEMDDTKPKQKTIEDVQLRDPDEDFPEPPGLRRREGATLIEENLEGDEAFTPEGHRIEDLEGDPDLAKETLRKLREDRTVEAAAEAIDALGDLEANADADGDPESEADPDAEPLRWEDLAEDVGASADNVMVKAKVDGQELEIPLSEAVQGYQRQETFTKKTMRLAERRKDLEGALEKTQQRLELLGQAAEALGPEQRQVLEAAYRRTLAEREAFHAHQLQTEVLPRESEALREKLGWDSQEDAQAGQEYLGRAAVEYGFEPAQLEQVYDHRLLVLLHDAMRYRELESRRSEVQQEVRSKKRNSKSLKPGTASRSPSGAKAARAAQKARNKAKRTGRLEDAAAAISHLID